MDINLPLILVVLSFAGILVWLYDLVFLKGKRNAVIADLQQNLPAWEEDGSPDQLRYEQRVIEDASEPVWVRETKSFLPIILLVLIVRSFIVEPFQIPSSSMEPTLDIGDFILVNKFSYGIRLPVARNKIIDVDKPQRGDVMVFFPPNDDRYFIKRVIGIPGDIIESKDKVLYVNGKEAELTRIPLTKMDIRGRKLFEEDLTGVKHHTFHRPDRPAYDFRVKVKEGHYFMMGDNRDNSSDSRVWGSVPEDRIVGKAFAIWMHWKDWKSVPSFSRVGKIQ